MTRIVWIALAVACLALSVSAQPGFHRVVVAPKQKEAAEATLPRKTVKAPLAKARPVTLSAAQRAELLEGLRAIGTDQGRPGKEELLRKVGVQRNLKLMRAAQQRAARASRVARPQPMPQQRQPNTGLGRIR